MADHNSFVNSGGDRGSQSDYYNQILPPLILTDDVQKKYSSFIKPDPLHIVKLGVMNDLISSLQKAFLPLGDPIGQWLQERGHLCAR